MMEESNPRISFRTATRIEHMSVEDVIDLAFVT
jgi:hypothetical protein